MREQDLAWAVQLCALSGRQATQTLRVVQNVDEVLRLDAIRGRLIVRIEPMRGQLLSH